MEATSSAIQKTNGHAIRKDVAPMDFTPEQRKLILDSFLNGASEQEAAVLLELARLRRLNPITRQIHFVKRWQRVDGQPREVWSAQVGIDGFRAIAERTGLYDGQDEAEFEYDTTSGKRALRLARVRIYRKDWSRPAVGVAHFSEYAQTKKDGGLVQMWLDKPHIMLAKCAEALAFRKAFPEDTSGLYAPEEMPHDEPRDVTPPKSTRAEQVRAALVAKTGWQPEAEEPPVDDAPPPDPDVLSAEDKPVPAVWFGKNIGTMFLALSDTQLKWYLEKARAVPEYAVYVPMLEAEKTRRAS